MAHRRAGGGSIFADTVTVHLHHRRYRHLQLNENFQDPPRPLGPLGKLHDLGGNSPPCGQAKCAREAFRVILLHSWVRPHRQCPCFPCKAKGQRVLPEAPQHRPEYLSHRSGHGTRQRTGQAAARQGICWPRRLRCRCCRHRNLPGLLRQPACHILVWHWKCD